MKFIIAAGIAVALIILAWQAGLSLKGLAQSRMQPAHVTLLLPSEGRMTCKLANGTLACVPRLVILPAEPVVAGAR